MNERGQQRRNALLITRNLPPLRGGMERLIHRIAQILSDDYDLAVIGPAGCAVYLPPSVTASEVPHQPLWRFLLGSASAIWKHSRRQVPRSGLVMAGSGLAAPLAWWAARRTRACFVIYLHGLDLVAPSAIYQLIWLPFIRRADLVLVNSRNTRRLAIERGIASQAIAVLNPGTELQGPNPAASQVFRDTHGLGERPVMLSVGRFTPRKGLVEFIAQAMPVILRMHPEAMLVVIGADASDAVLSAGESERARILRSAAAAGVQAAIRLLDPCDDATLSAAYSAADVHVFPVLDLPGEVEGFGMVAIEAAAHGVPTVGFRVGGVPDAIIDGESGSLVEAGDYLGFVSQVDRWFGCSRDPQRQARCFAAATAFSWDQFGERLHALLQLSLKKNKFEQRGAL